MDMRSGQNSFIQIFFFAPQLTSFKAIERESDKSPSPSNRMRWRCLASASSPCRVVASVARSAKQSVRKTDMSLRLSYSGKGGKYDTKAGGLGMGCWYPSRNQSTEQSHKGDHKGREAKGEGSTHSKQATQTGHGRFRGGCRRANPDNRGRATIHLNTRGRRRRRATPSGAVKRRHPCTQRMHRPSNEDHRG